VRFGAGTRLPAEPGEPIDAAVRLEANRYNGMVEPRVVLRHARPAQPEEITVIGEPESFASGVLAEIDRNLGNRGFPLGDAVAARQPDLFGAVESVSRDSRRTLRDRRHGGIAGLLADLAATGEPVLAVAAHAPHRARAMQSRIGGFAVCSWAALEDRPELAEPYRHVVAVDPPSLPAQRALVSALPGTGWAHLAWGEPELDFARRVLQWDYTLRSPLAAVYRALRAAGGARDEACAALLRGDGPQPRSAALAGRLVRVLIELRLVVLEQREGLAIAVPTAPERTALERSPAYRAYQRRLEDGQRFLSDDRIRVAA
jgi:single-stranded-DNA-specific exonuclease